MGTFSINGYRDNSNGGYTVNVADLIARKEAAADRRIAMQNQGALDVAHTQGRYGIQDTNIKETGAGQRTGAVIAGDLNKQNLAGIWGMHNQALQNQGTADVARIGNRNSVGVMGNKQMSPFASYNQSPIAPMSGGMSDATQKPYMSFSKVGDLYGGQFEEGGVIQGQVNPNTGDDTVIEAKKGEYVIPEPVVRELGSSYFDKLIAKHTGKTPPKASKRGALQGYSGGGEIALSDTERYVRQVMQDNARVARGGFLPNGNAIMSEATTPVQINPNTRFSMGSGGATQVPVNPRNLPMVRPSTLPDVMKAIPKETTRLMSDLEAAEHFRNTNVQKLTGKTAINLGRVGRGLARVSAPITVIQGLGTAAALTSDQTRASGQDLATQQQQQATTYAGALAPKSQRANTALSTNMISATSPYKVNEGKATTTVVPNRGTLPSHTGKAIWSSPLPKAPPDAKKDEKKDAKKDGTSSDVIMAKTFADELEKARMRYENAKTPEEASHAEAQYGTVQAKMQDYHLAMQNTKLREESGALARDKRDMDLFTPEERKSLIMAKYANKTDSASDKAFREDISKIKEDIRTGKVTPEAFAEFDPITAKYLTERGMFPVLNKEKKKSSFWGN